MSHAARKLKAYRRQIRKPPDDHPWWRLMFRHHNHCLMQCKTVDLAWEAIARRYSNLEDED